MPHAALSDNDRRKLAVARWLVRSVVSKHPFEVQGHVLIHMAAAIHDIDLVEKDLDS